MDEAKSTTQRLAKWAKVGTSREKWAQVGKVGKRCIHTKQYACYTQGKHTQTHTQLVVGVRDVVMLAVVELVLVVVLLEVVVAEVVVVGGGGVGEKG